MGKQTRYANPRYTLEIFTPELSNAPTVCAASGSRVAARYSAVTVAAEEKYGTKNSISPKMVEYYRKPVITPIVLRLDQPRAPCSPALANRRKTL